MRLRDDQVAAFRRDGWLHLVGVFGPAEVAAHRAWVEEVAAWADGSGPGLHHFELTDHGTALARSEDLVPYHDGLRALVTGGLIVDIVGELFGEPAMLFKEKINYKQPGGAGFAPHQDAPAYRFVDHHISCMVPVDPATEASGCLEVAPGFEQGLLPNVRGRIDDAVVAGLEWRAVPVAPGDVLVFDSYTPHRSGTNTTVGPRRALYLTYNAASAGDFRAAYYADKEAEFAGADGTFGGQRVRMSISDDFLGRPADA